MKRVDYEVAITAFEDLLTSSDSEAEYQRLFESHPVILETMGYTRWIPQPRLPIGGGKAYVPDFIVQLPDGTWEVLDLKTPEAGILLGRERREAFTAAMSSYIGQMHDYSDYFNDRANRDFVLAEYDVNVQPQPSSILIAGLNEDLDRQELTRQLRFRRGVRISTFDDVLLALSREHARHYPDGAPTFGITVGMVLELDEEPAKGAKYIFQMGNVLFTQLSLYIDASERLTLEMKSGISRQMISVKIGAGGVEYGETSILLAELALHRPHFSLQLRVDGQVVASTSGSYSETVSIERTAVCVGSDFNNANKGKFLLHDFFVLPKFLSFRDRLGILKNLHDEFIGSPQQPGSGQPSWLKDSWPKQYPQEALSTPGNRY